MKRFLLLSSCLALALPVCLHAQAMTEYGLSVGRSTLGGASAAKKMGDATGAVLSKTGQAVESAGTKARPQASSAQTSAQSQPTVMRVQTAQSAGQTGAVSGAAASPALGASTATPAAPPKPVDLAAITPGLDRQDLLAKAGKPSMKITSTEGGDEVEKYWYRTAGGNAVVTLRNGKVAAVSPPAVR